MNPTTSMHEPAIRDIPLCRLALAPENVRKTPPDAAARDEPTRALPDAERRVTELALAGVVDPRWAAGAGRAAP